MYVSASFFRATKCVSFRCCRWEFCENGANPNSFVPTIYTVSASLPTAFCRSANCAFTLSCVGGSYVGAGGGGDSTVVVAAVAAVAAKFCGVAVGCGVVGGAGCGAVSVSIAAESALDAFLNSRKPLPTALPTSGSLDGPKTMRPTIKIRTNSGIPIPNNLFSPPVNNCVW